MNFMRIFTLLLLLQNVGIVDCLSQQLGFKDWESHDSKYGMKIYTKNSTGSIKNFGAQFRVEGSVLKIVELLKYVDNYEQWIIGIFDSKLVESINDSLYVYHFYVRKTILGIYTIKKDGVVSSKVIKSGNGIVIESNLDSSAEHENPYQRIEHYHVRWTLSPDGMNRTLVTYEGIVDVRVNFLYGLIQNFIMNSLSGTFHNMQSIIVND